MQTITINGKTITEGQELNDGRTIERIADGKVTVYEPAADGVIYGNRNRSNGRRTFKANSKILAAIVARHA